MSRQQLPGETQEVVRGETREIGHPSGDEDRCEQHESEHVIGIGSHTRNLKRALPVASPVQRGRLVALD
jgi:hypothetical protein